MLVKAILHHYLIQAIVKIINQHIIIVKDSFHILMEHQTVKHSIYH